MEVKAQLLVLGAKFFRGEVEKNSHDNTKLFVAMEVPDKNADTYGRVGYDAVDIKFGKAEEYSKLKHLTFPLMAELSLKFTTEGYECTGFKPVQSPARQPA